MLHMLHMSGIGFTCVLSCKAKNHQLNCQSLFISLVPSYSVMMQSSREIFKYSLYIQLELLAIVVINTHSYILILHRYSLIISLISSQCTFRLWEALALRILVSPCKYSCHGLA